MIDGIANQVNERVANLIDDRPIEFRLRACDLKLDFFMDVFRDRTYHAWEAVEHLLDRHHPERQDE